MLGLNVLNVGCKNGAHSPLMSIYAYGSPILYLVIQVVVLLLLIIWLEGDMALFRRNGVPVARADNEKSVAVRSIEVEAEKVRVANSEDDLMRILGLDKSFGSNHAVNNVSLGLTKGEVMALLGPNGAGKSTMVNMIQSELSPDHGKILLCGEDSRVRSAQKYLGSMSFVPCIASYADRYSLPTVRCFGSHVLQETTCLLRQSERHQGRQGQC